MAKISLYSLIVILVAGICASWIAGTLLISPVQHDIGPPPVDMLVTNVSFHSESGTLIHGWFIPSAEEKGVVLLFHGVRADRRSMLPRAKFLHEIGYSVLLIDFQAHGESIGKSITFGALESKDVEAAVNYLKINTPNKPIAIIGVSLGGAATILARQPLNVQAVILESVYPTIEEAMDDRLRVYLGPIGPMLSPFLILQLKFRLGISPNELRPIDHIEKIHAPLLLINGTEDMRTTISEAKNLFACASQPKQFWSIDGAAHVDLYNFAPEEYRENVSSFISKAFSSFSEKPH